MSIEQEIFNTYEVIEDKLVEYGFKYKENKLEYVINILNDKFKIIIEYDNEIKGKIIDLEFGDEYTNYRRENLGEFNTNIKYEFIKILTDIRDKCFIKSNFMFPQTRRINDFIYNYYKVKPEFLWDKYPGFAVYRKTKKWFALIGNVLECKVNKNKDSNKMIEVINVKVSENEIDSYLSKKGYYEAYHMNKRNWVSIILDDSLSDDDIKNMIIKSYDIVNESNTWLIPANPNYYDIINAFAYDDTIIWKQSSDINVGDIVYIYVTKPYSKILYKTLAVEVNIPYSYKDKNIKMNYVMKLRLLKDLKYENYDILFLSGLGIKTVRGPRKIKKEISNLLD